MGFEDSMFVKDKGDAATGNVFLDAVNSIASSNTVTKENIESILSIAGSAFDFDTICIKESFENGAAVKCTFEWNRRGPSLIKGVERRFLATTINSLRKEYKKNGGYYYWDKDSDKECLINIIESGCVVSLFHFPIYKEARFLGCVDFMDSRRSRGNDVSIVGMLMKFTGMLANMLDRFDNTHPNITSQSALSKKDSLTNLLKFDEFMRLVEDKVRDDVRHNFVVVSTDISNFKYINEKYGYNVGDMFLKLIPYVMYQYLRRIISSCREYQDIFLFAMRISKGITNENIQNLVNTANEAFLESVRPMIGDTKVALNSGFCIVRDNEISVEEAVTYATAARKASKMTTVLQGSRCFAYEKKMTEDKGRTLELISSCDRALAAGEFKVFFQPKVKCSDFSVVGAEALIRWQKKDGRFIYPDEFIPAFEQNGCIVKTDYFVYDKVFTFLRDRLDCGKKCVPISMNVSRIHLYNTEFIDYIDKLMKKYNVPAEYLEFEITENICLENLPTAQFTLMWLRKNNMKVSIDDFGSGYSSLDILTKLPINILKLDKIFMKDSLEPKDKIIITSIVNMAKKLDLEVICEGVEHEEQRRFLIDACCEKLQGYIFSKPVDEESFNKILENLSESVQNNEM